MPRYIVEAVVDTGKAVQSVRGLRTEFDKTGKEAKKTFKDDIGGGAEEAARKIGLTEAELQQLSSGLKTAGVAAAAMGAVILAGFTVAVKGAADFQLGITNVTNLIGPGGKALAGPFSEGIRKVAIEFGQGKEALTQGLFDIVSAGVDTKIAADGTSEALTLLNSSALLATAGVTSVGTTTSALLTTMKSYEDSVRDAADASDFLFSIQKFGRTTLEEVASTFGNIAPLASQAGLSLEDLGASFSAATLGGTSTAETVTALAALMKTFIAPTDDAIAAASALGFEMSSASLSGDNYTDTLEKISKGTVEQINAIAGSVRGFKALAPIVQDLNKFQEIRIGILNREGLAAAAAANVQDTFNNTMDRAAAAADNVSDRIGEALLPKLTELGDELVIVLGQTEDWVAKNDELTQSLVLFGGGAGVAAVALGSMTIGLGFLISSLTTIGGALGVVIPLIGTAGLAGIVVTATAAVGLFTVGLGTLWAEMKLGQEIGKTLGKVLLDWAGQMDTDIEALEDLEENMRKVDEATADLTKTAPQWLEILRLQETGIIDSTEAVDDTTKAMDELEKTWGKASATGGDLTDELNDLTQAVKSQEAALASAEAQYQATNGGLERFSSANHEATLKVDELRAANEAATISLQNITPPLSDFGIEAANVATKTNAATTAVLAMAGALDTIPAPDLTGELEALSGVVNQQTADVIALTPEWNKANESLGNAKPPSEALIKLLPQVSTAVTDLGKTMTDIVLHGGSAKDALVAFGETIIRIGSEAIMGLLLSQLFKLIGLLPGLNSIKDALGGIFNFAFGAFPGLPGATGFPGQTPPTVPGGGGGGGGGGSFGGATAIGTLIAPGIGTAIGAAIDIGIQALGLIGGAKRETTLNAIELNTRNTERFLGGRADQGILGVQFRILNEIAFGTTNKAVLLIKDKIVAHLPTIEQLLFDISQGVIAMPGATGEAVATAVESQGLTDEETRQLNTFGGLESATTSIDDVGEAATRLPPRMRGAEESIEDVGEAATRLPPRMRDVANSIDDLNGSLGSLGVDSSSGRFQTGPRQTGPDVQSAGLGVSPSTGDRFRTGPRETGPAPFTGNVEGTSWDFRNTGDIVDASLDIATTNAQIADNTERCCQLIAAGRTPSVGIGTPVGFSLPDFTIGDLLQGKTPGGTGILATDPEIFEQLVDEVHDVQLAVGKAEIELIDRIEELSGFAQEEVSLVTTLLDVQREATAFAEQGRAEAHEQRANMQVLLAAIKKSNEQIPDEIRRLRSSIESQRPITVQVAVNGDDDAALKVQRVLERRLPQALARVTRSNRGGARTTIQRAV